MPFFNKFAESKKHFMIVTETKIKDLYIIEPKIFGDERGYFFEVYSERDFRKETGLDMHFVQDNESKSSKGVLRGLHFQKNPYSQAMLIRVVHGSVQDVAVDLRSGSPTFGQYVSVILSEANKKMFFIPAGFAHGFLTLEDDVIFQYKCSQFYEPSSEGSIRWDDPDIGVEWMLKGEDYLLSPKDMKAPSFKDHPFNF